MTDLTVPEAALERILREGLQPPVTVRSRLTQLWSAVGPENLFLGTVTRVLAALTLSIGLVVLIGSSGGSLGLLFALSPLLGLSLTGFVEGAERLGPLAELRRTLRYSGPQLAAFRILVFALAGLAFGVVLALLSGSSGAYLAHALMISSAAVSISAVLAVAVSQRTASRWLAAALPVGWALVWLPPALLATGPWEAVLAGVPAALGWLAAAAAAALFARQLHVLLMGRAFTVPEITHAAG